MLKSCSIAVALLLGGALMYGQTASSVRVTPQTATLLIGQTQEFRAVDNDGHLVPNTSWTVVGPDSPRSAHGGDLVFTPRQAGDYVIAATTGIGSAEARVTVKKGENLAPGTVIWSSGEPAGCTTKKIIPASPSAAGPDSFSESDCPDGKYITAYAASGIELWRHKMSDSGSGAADKNHATPAPAHIQDKSKSICESIEVGNSEAIVRQVLRSHSLPFDEKTVDGRSWTIDESDSQCKIWWNEKNEVVRKRKILVVQ